MQPRQLPHGAVGHIAGANALSQRTVIALHIQIVKPKRFVLRAAAFKQKRALLRAKPDKVAGGHALKAVLRFAPVKDLCAVQKREPGVKIHAANAHAVIIKAFNLHIITPQIT